MKRILSYLILSLGFLTSCTKDSPPPVNPHLSTGAWSMPHVKSYQRNFTELKGPMEVRNMLTKDDIKVVYSSPITISLSYSTPYSDGKTVLWASQSDRIVKYDADDKNLTVIDLLPLNGKEMITEEEIKERIKKMDSLSRIEFMEYINRFKQKEREKAIIGVHSVLDKNNTFFVAERDKIVAYGDTVPGDWKSPIEVKNVYKITEEKLDPKTDWITGMNMTYDGTLIFVLTNGMLGAVSTDFTESQIISLGEGITVSNSIAIDEDGGIFVVTSENLQRVQWTGTNLSKSELDGAWVASYETGSDPSQVGLLGTGSSSTPALMGSRRDDKLVVITDGGEMMSLVFFWRDKIPSDWNQIPGTLDKRIAAQVPVTFGNPYLASVQSERSVIVNGYGAAVVNNSLRKNFDDPIVSALASGDPSLSAYGIEKFQWDSNKRLASSVWSNSEVSAPTAISTLSNTTSMIYTNGQRDGVWTIEAVDWKTGDSIFHYNLGKSVLFNSCYSGVQLLDHKDIIFGSFGGVIRINTP